MDNGFLVIAGMKKFLLVMLVALGFRWVACADSDYMKYVQWGDDAIAKGKWSEAIGYLEEAMRTEPSNPLNVMLLSNVGMLHHYAGEDSLALHTLSEARAMAPSSVVILNNRARVLTAMGRNDDAMRDYGLIIEMDSTYADAWYDRAALQMRMAHLELAEADARHFVALRPNDLQGKLLMAVIYSNTHRPAEAIPLYTDLIRAKPEAVYYSARAMCHLQQDELAEASADIASGLELAPDDPELYYCRAFLNILRYREEDARTDAAHAVSLGLDPVRAAALFGEGVKK